MTAPAPQRYAWHSKGPWKWEPERASRIADANGQTVACVYDPVDVPHREIRANAELIAAAPQLLADLTALRERVAELEAVLAFVETSEQAQLRDLRDRCAAKDARVRELRNAIQTAYECGEPTASHFYDEEGVEGWRWTHPDGREWTEFGDWTKPAPIHPLLSAALDQHPADGAHP